jgi:UDP-glucuronate 4-epimerase
MHIFLTGGAGFIGSHTVERLIARGDRVTALDAFDFGYDPALKEANAAVLERLEGFRLVRGDIRDRGLLEQIFTEDPPDVVVHLAARAGVRPSLEDPASYIDINLNGTVQILETMRAHGVKRMVFASSSSVYGARDKGPFRETDDVDVPVSPYAATKRSGELLMATYNHLYGIHTTCLRFFTVYGPRQRPEMAIHLFADRIRRGQEITMFGDGSSLRDYTFIDDIVNGVVAAVDRPLGHQIINLGNCTPTRLDELIRSIGEAVGRPPVVRQVPDQPGDVPMTFASTGRAAELLDFTPDTPILEGLRRFVAWLNESHPVQD